ncbi:MAG: septum formation protein Maf [Acholeplasmataceae bacterium]|jgi:septum formation protein|nr:septum formation protein Maf [Acholeplasmataceae bacterium]
MLVLASNSERRRKLLQDIGLNFEVMNNDVSEEVQGDLNPEDLVMVLSKRKAEAALLKRPNDTIIAADTIVCFDGAKLGKPKTDEEAFEMLKKIAGTVHNVYTGVTIINKEKEKTFYEMASVYMKNYNDIQIYEYIKTGEPIGKAGGYAIQGKGGQLVEKHIGDFFTIVGLPLKKLQKELAEFDY